MRFKIESSERKLWTSKECLTAEEFLHNIRFDLNCLQDTTVISNEAMMDNVIGRAFISISDSFAGLFNTLRANIFKLNESLKRSELKQFVDSNVLKVGQVEGLTYDKVMKLQVPIPDGMMVQYLIAVQDINSLQNELAIVALVKMAEMAFTNFFKSFARGDSKALDQALNIKKLLESRLALIQKSSDKFNKDFSGGKTTTVKFTSAYGSMADFKKVREMLTDMQRNLQDVKTVTTSVETIERALEGTLNLIQSNEATIQKEFIQAVADAATAMATLIDIYGSASTRQAAIEHNHILIINQLYNI